MALIVESWHHLTNFGQNAVQLLDVEIEQLEGPTTELGEDLTEPLSGQGAWTDDKYTGVWLLRDQVMNYNSCLDSFPEADFIC